ncbi:GTP cyclohydrolase II [Nocardia sp. NPDC005746]|uniref:GTP cyclohydrolase II n=1 Tax=Nocardia sp. NPDC005746 TaxID=3157062 RepID=UPI00340485A4
MSVADESIAVADLVNSQKLACTSHLLTRKGAEIRVRVHSIPGRDGGQALIFGDIDRLRAPLVRIHSRCLYGDALHSDDCDCGPELDQAMDMIQRADAGVLLYLEQEGRGAGLEVKAKGLRVTQTEGRNTFDAYRALGFEPDSREFDTAARFLTEQLGLHAVSLLTNNPDKVHALQRGDITVTPVPLITEPRSHWAREYMEAKRIHRGHRLPPYSFRRIGRRIEQTCFALGVVATTAAIYWAPRELAVLAFMALAATAVTWHPARTSVRLRLRAWRRQLAQRPRHHPTPAG